MATVKQKNARKISFNHHTNTHTQTHTHTRIIKKKNKYLKENKNNRTIPNYRRN